MAKVRKISDENFWAILRENGGLYSRTARAIEKKYNIKYTRQAVRDRAMQDLEQYADIEEENIDIAEEGLMTLMRSKNERVRLQAIQMYLKTKGKKRGYIERQEVTGADGKDLYKPLEYDKLSLDELRRLKEIADKLEGDTSGDS